MSRLLLISELLLLLWFFPLAFTYQSKVKDHIIIKTIYKNIEILYDCKESIKELKKIGL